MFERLARAERDTGKRVIGDGNRKAGVIAQHLIEIGQQRPATREHDALDIYVGYRFTVPVLQHRIVPG